MISKTLLKVNLDIQTFKLYRLMVRIFSCIFFWYYMSLLIFCKLDDVNGLLKMNFESWIFFSPPYVSSFCPFDFFVPSFFSSFRPSFLSSFLSFFILISSFLYFFIVFFSTYLLSLFYLLFFPFFLSPFLLARNHFYQCCICYLFLFCLK